jgi:hypothetical protein
MARQDERVKFKLNAVHGKGELFYPADFIGIIVQAHYLQDQRQSPRMEKPYAAHTCIKRTSYLRNSIKDLFAEAVDGDFYHYGSLLLKTPGRIFTDKGSVREESDEKTLLARGAVNLKKIFPRKRLAAG